MARKSAFEIKPDVESLAKIKVIGIGGSGGSAINRMLSTKIRGIEFLAMNTDVQALRQSLADVKLQIGKDATKGLGAGMDPELGLRSAEESEAEIMKHMAGADMIFITCGLGGGTGSGAVSVLADLARAAGALTVAVVTKPFKFEGVQRRSIAEAALDRLDGKVDTIITIPNDRLLQIIDKKTSLLQAFSVVDEILRQGVLGISELITVPGLVNVDFADVKSIMADAGSALMGIGVGSGETRAADAARSAIESPLLELSIDGARGILFVVTAGEDLTMHEVNEAAEIITASTDPEAKVIFGTVIDPTMEGELKITVIATGFKHFRDETTNVTKQDVEVDTESFRPDTFVKKSEASRSNFTSPAITAEENDDEDEELQIPAFIRNKMKK